MRVHARCIGLVAACAALSQAAAFDQHSDVARRGLLGGLLGILGGGHDGGDENQGGGNQDQDRNNNGNGNGGNAAETVTTTVRQTITVGAAGGGQFGNASTVTATVTMTQQAAAAGEAGAGAQKCESRVTHWSVKAELTDIHQCPVILLDHNCLRHRQSPDRDHHRACLHRHADGNITLSGSGCRSGYHGGRSSADHGSNDSWGSIICRHNVRRSSWWSGSSWHRTARRRRTDTRVRAERRSHDDGGIADNGDIGVRSARSSLVSLQRSGRGLVDVCRACCSRI